MPQRLGQHFLQNKSVLRRAAQELKIKPGERVIEIGPGHGELTSYLIEAGAKVTALERDPRFAEALPGKFPGLEVRRGDALKLLPAAAEEKGSYKLAGNIPYYITGFLFRLLGELPRKPLAAAFVIQKEVGERLTAEPPEMNRLSAAVKFWAHPEYVRTVPASDFRPKPRVDSALVALTPRKEPLGPDPEAYYKALRVLFGQPRKTILNNVAAALPKGERPRAAEILAGAGLDPALRPGSLSPEDILRISFLIR